MASDFVWAMELPLSCEIGDLVLHLLLFEMLSSAKSFLSLRKR
jgi:hypothetical protein